MPQAALACMQCQSARVLFGALMQECLFEPHKPWSLPHGLLAWPGWRQQPIRRAAAAQEGERASCPGRAVVNDPGVHKPPNVSGGGATGTFSQHAEIKIGGGVAGVLQPLIILLEWSREGPVVDLGPLAGAPGGKAKRLPG